MNIIKLKQRNIYTSHYKNPNAIIKKTAAATTAIQKMKGNIHRILSLQ